MPGEDVLARLREESDYEVIVDSKRYQVEVQLLEHTPEYLHVSIAVDDGSLPGSIRPECNSFLCQQPETPPSH
jgi:hypothetical protein